MLCDGVAIGMAAASQKDRALRSMLGVGVGTYALCSPVVHLAQGHEGKALLSAGLRVVVPAVGLGLLLRQGESFDTGSSHEDTTPSIGALLLLVGIPATMIFDYSVLGLEDLPPRQSGLVPFVQPAGQGVTAGARGVW